MVAAGSRGQPLGVAQQLQRSSEVTQREPPFRRIEGGAEATGVPGGDQVTRGVGGVGASRLECRRGLPGLGALVGASISGSQPLGHLDPGMLGGLACATAAPAPAGVEHDLEEPGAGRGVPTEGGRAAPGGEQPILQGVLRVASRPAVSVREAEQGCAVTVDEQTEGRAIARGAPLHEPLVARTRLVPWKTGHPHLGVMRRGNGFRQAAGNPFWPPRTLPGHRRTHT